MKIVYQANDGKIFETARKCKEHEANIDYLRRSIDAFILMYTFKWMQDIKKSEE